MKILPILLVVASLIGLPTVTNAQLTLSTSRSLKLKTYDENSGEAQVLFKGLLQSGKTDKLNFTLGYGQLLGKSWIDTKSSFGVFGSGLLNSDMYSSVSRLGINYTSAINDYKWGKNGLNFSMDGNLGGLTLGGSYSGYLDAYSFNFSGKMGKSFTGKGMFIMEAGQIKALQSDIEVKF